MILLLVGGCFLTGDKGDTGLTGSSGSSGPTGAPGEDAVISTYTYSEELAGKGNPYQGGTPEVSLTSVEAGTQTVDGYMYAPANDEWISLPVTGHDGTVQFDHHYYVGEGYVAFETWHDGVLYVGDALYGRRVLVIVKNYNK